MKNESKITTGIRRRAGQYEQYDQAGAEDAGRRAGVQEELEQREYTGKSGGGMVEATVTGDHQLKSVTINPEAVDPDDVEMLQDMIVAAVNEAEKLADDTANEEMGKITGGFSVPGMEGLL